MKTYQKSMKLVLLGSLIMGIDASAATSVGHETSGIKLIAANGQCQPANCQPGWTEGTVCFNGGKPTCYPPPPAIEE